MDAGESDDAAIAVAQMRDRLFRVAMAVCGDRDMAEEAVADAIARSWHRLRTGRVDDPAAYLRRAVINSLTGRFRRLGLEREVRDRRHGDDRGRHDRIDGVADRALVLDALEQLPRRQRIVVTLRFYEGLSNPQIASAMGVPVGTVKSAMSRAMERLRPLLEGSAGA